MHNPSPARGRDHEAEEAEDAVKKRTVQGVIGVAAHQVDARLEFTSHDECLLVAALGTGQVADRAGNDADRMTAFLHQAASQFVVACAAGFVQCCKSLVDEEVYACFIVSEK